jgi:hypothetical protein
LTFETDIKPLVTAEAAVLSATLHECLALAIADGRTRNKGIPHDRFPFQLPMSVRCSLRLHLEARDLPQGWQVAGEPRQMGQLLLEQPDLGLQWRFLKERRSGYPGGVPIAGRNPKRRQVWSSDELDLRLPQPSEVPGPPQMTTQLWVWDFDGAPDNPKTGFTQRLVHTLEPGVYGRAVPCDLSLDLLPQGGILDRLTFQGTDENTDFFSVELAETANDEA